MKRGFICLICIVMMSVTVACGSKKEEVTTTTSGSEKEEECVTTEAATSTVGSGDEKVKRSDNESQMQTDVDYVEELRKEAERSWSGEGAELGEAPVLDE